MRGYRALLHGCGVAAALVIGLSALLVCYDVLARNLGVRSLTWVVEVTEYALPLATLLAAPWLMLRFEHIRLDLLQQLLPAAAQRHIDRIAAIIGAVVSALLVWYSARVLLDTREIGALVMKSLVFPEWWLYLPLPFCFALLAAECTRRVFAERPGGAAQAAEEEF
jgi:TRAP-type C4-dicarboxylate transport system permease small subunit